MADYLADGLPDDWAAPATASAPAMAADGLPDDWAPPASASPAPPAPVLPPVEGHHIGTGDDGTPVEAMPAPAPQFPGRSRAHMVSGVWPPPRLPDFADIRSRPDIPAPPPRAEPPAQSPEDLTFSPLGAKGAALLAGPQDYEQMGTLGRVGAQFSSGVEALKESAKTLGINSVAHDIAEIQAIDGGQAPYDPLTAAYASSSPEERRAYANSLHREFGEKLASLMQTEHYAASIPRNPRNDALRQQVASGDYAGAWNTFASDPAGILQQAIVPGLPIMAPMIAAGAAAAPLGALGRVAATAGSAFGTALGSRQLGEINRALQQRGVNVEDPQQVAAALQADPGIVGAALSPATRAATVDGLVQALMHYAAIPLRPGISPLSAVGRIGANAAAQPAMMAGGEAAAQVAAHGGVEDQGAVADAALGSLPFAAWHVGAQTAAAHGLGIFGPRPGTGMGAYGPSAPGGQPGGGPSWQSVLGFPSSLVQAEAAYRRAARVAHPDLGGSQEQMAMLNDAIAQARAAFGAARPAAGNEPPSPASAPTGAGEAPPPPAAPQEPSTPEQAAATAAGARSYAADPFVAPAAPPMPAVRPLAEIQRQDNLSPAGARDVRAAEEQALANWHATYAPFAPMVMPPAGEPLRDDHAKKAELAAILNDPRSAEEIQAANALPAPVQPASAAPTAPPAPAPVIRLGDGTRTNPVVAQQPNDVHAAASLAAEPTPAQAAAGNYQKGHITIGGLPVSIETPAGATRSGIGPDGTPWSVVQPADYGYIKRTKGADGDHLDVYLGPEAHNAASLPVYVIDQRDADTHLFDEHKAMLGFPTREAAELAYHAAFSDGRGPDRMGALTQMPFSQFRQWAKAGNTKKALAYQGPDRAIEAAMAELGVTLPKARIPDVARLMVGRGYSPQGAVAVVAHAHALELEAQAAAQASNNSKWSETHDEQQPSAVAAGAGGAAAGPVVGVPGEAAAGSGEPGGDRPDAAASVPGDAADAGSARPGAAVVQQSDVGNAAPVAAPESAAAGEADLASQATSYGTPERPDSIALADAFSRAFRDGQRFASIVQARQLAARLVGGAIQPGTLAAKAVDEAVELGVVYRAVEIANARGAKPDAIFDQLLALYEAQPLLSTRTADSAIRQAYSTPVPLAYVADVLAGITDRTTVYEPTAGNGALLILASPPRVTANEIDPARVRALRDQGFHTLHQDAAELDPIKTTASPAVEDGYDVVIANPPFGPVRSEDGRNRLFDLGWLQPNYQTHEIDHAIALRALTAMKADGRGVLILGGLNKLIKGDEARAAAYNNSKAKREFFYLLYQRFNVVDHFTVPGELYAKQGAAWPVDVIVIHGKGQSARKLPSIEAPRIVASWSALREMLDGRDQGLAAGGTGAAGVVGGSRSGAVGNPADAGRPAAADGARPLPEPAGAPGAVDDGSRGGLEAGGERVGGVAGAGGGARGRNAVAGVGGGSGRPVRNATPDAASAGAGGREPPKPPVVGPAAAGSGSGDRMDAVRGLGEPPAGGARPAVEDEFEAALRAALDEAFGPEISPVTPPASPPSTNNAPASPPAPGPQGAQTPPTVAASAKSAAEAAAEAMTKAAEGLFQLFGGGDGARLGSGPTFDEETYAKAKPFFREAFLGAKKVASSIGDMARAIIEHFKNVTKWGRELITRMIPYLKRYREDLEAGRETLEEQPARDVAQKKAAEPARPAEVETEHQVSYDPISRNRAVGTLVPANLKSVIAQALADVAAKAGGDIDASLASRLGYSPDEFAKAFSAEQADALGLAMDQMDQGKGFIIGDQTGVGKGRFVAALIRYADRKGLIPVFVTEKNALYADMYRDLTDIGSTDIGKAILPTDAGFKLPLTENPDGPALRTPDAKAHLETLRAIGATGKLPDGKRALFTTYTQMQERGDGATPRQQMLAAIMPTSFLILDESHNAGGAGQSDRQEKGKMPRSDFFRQMVRNAASAAFSSATWAKRPDVMTLYALKTDMAKAVKDVSQLPDAIKAGGIPLQQIMTAQLARAGQYIRRERSFDGVAYDTHSVPVDEERYAAVCKVLADIFLLSDKYIPVALKAIKSEIKEGAGTIGPDGAVGYAAVSNTGFSSIMHNLVSQMLLAIKTPGLIDLIDADIKAGRQAVVALTNTMSAFLSDYAELTGTAPGQPMPITFNNLLLRYLDRTRRYVVKPPFAKKGEKGEVHWLDVADLSQAGQNLYRSIEQDVNSLDLSNMPVSPIDYMRAELRRLGHEVDEITGRSEALDYTAGGKAIYRVRGDSDKSGAARVKARNGFNAGKIKVLILNQSGSTGISLHASERNPPAGQGQRVMYVLQADPNIDTFMQMLGRVHRTGQVKLPRYVQLVADVPAENRPAAVLSAKMASLNASTTAARKSAIGSDVMPDFMNEYGARAMEQFLSDNPDMNTALGNPAGAKETDAAEDDDGGANRRGEVDPLAVLKKATGRVAMLPPPTQREFYEQFLALYKAVLDEAEAGGVSVLEAKRLDLDAKPLESHTIHEGVPGSQNPFEAPARLVRADVKRLTKPPEPVQILGEIMRGLGAGEEFNPAQYADRSPSDIADKITVGTYALTERALDARIAAVDEALTKRLADAQEIEQDAKRAAIIARLEAQAARLKDTFQLMQPGQMVALHTKENPDGEQALVVAIKQRPKTSSVTPSSWDVVLMRADGARTVSSMSVFWPPSAAKLSSDDTGVRVTEAPGADLGEFLQSLVDQRQEQREERWLATGNVLAAYQQRALRRGNIVNFTDNQGAVRQGILMPRSFNGPDFLGSRAAQLSPEMAQAFLRSTDRDLPPSVNTPDRKLIVAQTSRGDYLIQVPSSNKEGGSYWKDPALKAAIGDRYPSQEFVKAGDQMRAKFPVQRLASVMAALGPIMDREQAQFTSIHPGINSFVARMSGGVDQGPDTTPRFSIGRPVGQGNADHAAEAGAPAPEAVAALLEAAREMTGGQVDVAMAGSAGSLAGPLRNGAMVEPNGLAFGRLIRVVLSDRADWVMHHEVIHALRNLGVFTPGEWATLRAAAQREGWHREFGIAKRYPTLDANGQDEEAVADKFGQWASGAAPEPKGGLLGRIWRKFLAFLGRARNALAGRGFQTADDVFQRVEAGEVGRRAPGSGLPQRGPRSVDDSRAELYRWSSAAFDNPAGPKYSLGTPPVPSTPPPAKSTIRTLDDMVEAVRKVPLIGEHMATLATHMLNAGDAVQMMVTPMAAGSVEARAIVKDFANMRRWNRFQANAIVESLGKEFPRDRLEAMWEAADAESVSMQQGNPMHGVPGIGLNTLSPRERQVVKELQDMARVAFERARAAGLHDAEGLPSYVPRMVVDIGMPGSTKVVRDIRTLPVATTMLNEAIAGRLLMNRIRDAGQRAGMQTVSEGGPPPSIEPLYGVRTSSPQLRRRKHLTVEETEQAASMLTGDDGLGWFTIPQSPAFYVTRVVGSDADGNPIQQRVPLYVRKDFEGPLRSVLYSPEHLLYRAMMDLKGRMMTAIMYGVAHLGVIAGRALAVSPHLVRIAREGNVARKDMDLMRRAIVVGGMAPIGRNFARRQDAEGIQALADLQPGRSWTAQTLAFVPGLVSQRAGDAVKRGVDAAGHFMHNTLLWDRVADLQAGLFVNFERKFLAEGMAPEEAAQVAAHYANRFSGALPQEAMSQNATRLANMLLFSRSYRIGTAGLYKDALNGLPRDVRAQIERAKGYAAMKRVQGRARRLAIAALLVDFALYYAGNSALQSAANVMLMHRSLSDEAHGYVERIVREATRVASNPAVALNPFGVLASLTPGEEHEPGKEDRILIGYDQQGTGIYVRNPLGKTQEDMADYWTQPLMTAHAMMSPFAKAALGVFQNDAGLGRHVYDPYVQTPADYLRAAADVAGFIMEQSGPSTAIRAAKRLLTGQGTGFDAAQIVAGGLGVSVSHGYPGGPAMGMLAQSKREHAYEVERALPSIRDKIKAGDTAGAAADLRRLQVAPGLIRYIIQHTLHPGMTRNQLRAAAQYTAPDEWDRIMGIRAEELRARAADQPSPQQ